MERQDLVLLMEAGYIYMGMGRFDEAREVFEGISVLSPTSEIPLVALGTAYFATKQFDRAIAFYKKALSLRGDSSFARAYLGEALIFKGKKSEGVKELEKASILDPSGTAGEFARSLMEAIKNGFVPPQSQHA